MQKYYSVQPFDFLSFYHLQISISRIAKEALKTKLPAFVPAGEFSYRDTKSLTKYRGRIVMDIDKIKDPERLRALIKSNREPSVIMAFLSPSGNGLKVIHQLDCPDLKSIEETGDFHKQAFLSLINLYKSKYKVTEIRALTHAR